MSTVTTYLNLVKPASPEQFSLATYNNNLDLVDARAVIEEKKAKGTVASVSEPATSTGLSSTGVMCNLVAVNLVAGRWYKVSYAVQHSSTTGVSDAIACVFNKSIVSDVTASGTNLHTAGGSLTYYIYTSPAANFSKTDTPWVRFKATATETVNIKAVMARATGSSAYSITTRELLVEDMGAQI